MFNIQDPDGLVSVTTFHPCPYHKLNPGGHWDGCTCSGSFSQRAATPWEREENKKRRLEAEKRHGEALAQLYGFGGKG